MCLRCSTPDEYLHLPIEDLPSNEELPECNKDIIAAGIPPYNGNQFFSEVRYLLYPLTKRPAEACLYN